MTDIVSWIHNPDSPYPRMRVKIIRERWPVEKNASELYIEVEVIPAPPLAIRGTWKIGRVVDADGLENHTA